MNRGRTGRSEQVEDAETSSGLREQRGQIRKILSNSVCAEFAPFPGVEVRAWSQLPAAAESGRCVSAHGAPLL